MFNFLLKWDFNTVVELATTSFLGKNLFIKVLKNEKIEDIFSLMYTFQSGK